MKRHQKEQQEPPKLYCIECEKNKLAGFFSRRSDGTYRSKCNSCLQAYNDPYTRKIQPAPSDFTPLPKIVREALKTPKQEEIETFPIVQKPKDEKVTEEFLLGDRKHTRGGKR